MTLLLRRSRLLSIVALAVVFDRLSQAYGRPLQAEER